MISVCICIVVLLVLGSLTNVVGYQTVQSSNQQEEIIQKDLLFQTISDIVNDKEVQRIIIKSQIIRGRSPASHISILSKNQLRQMYLIGMMLSKIITKSRLHQMVERYQLNDIDIQKELNAVIEKNPTIQEKITQLQNSKCDCENENTIGLWKFPVICMIIYPIFAFFAVLYVLDVPIARDIAFLLDGIGTNLDCFWAPFLTPT